MNSILIILLFQRVKISLEISLFQNKKNIRKIFSLICCLIGQILSGLTCMTSHTCACHNDVNDAT